MISIKIKRIYEAAEAKDGFRILVDGLWPRGLTKEKAAIDCWIKSAAPSSTLRKWFAHDPGKWVLFIKKYNEELKQPGVCDELIECIRKNKPVTLLYAARDERYNNAVVLQKFVQDFLNRKNS